MQSVPYIASADGIQRGSAATWWWVPTGGAGIYRPARGAISTFKFVVISKKPGINSGSRPARSFTRVARGAFYDESINNDPGINKYQMKDPFRGVRMLAADRLDAVISSDYLLTALKQAGLSKADFFPAVCR